MKIDEELNAVAAGNIEEAQPAQGVEMTEWVFANEKNPALRQLFHSLYSGVFTNRVGLAHCKNIKTGELQTLLVGVNPTETGAQLFPLAVVIEEANVGDYASPDGKGGFIEPDNGGAE